MKKKTTFAYKVSHNKFVTYSLFSVFYFTKEKRLSLEHTGLPQFTAWRDENLLIVLCCGQLWVRHMFCGQDLFIFPLIVLGYPLDSKRSYGPLPDTLCFFPNVPPTHFYFQSPVRPRGFQMDQPLKLSVSALFYPWVTATQHIVLEVFHEIFHDRCLRCICSNIEGH